MQEVKESMDIVKGYCQFQDEVFLQWRRVFPGGSESKESARNVGDLGSIPGVGKIPLEKGIAVHSSSPAWRIPMDRGAWRAAVHGVAKCYT